MKKSIAVIIIMWILGIGEFSGANMMRLPFENDCGVFSWYREDLEDESFFDICSQTVITEVYQMFEHECTDDSVVSFVKRASDRNVKVYALCGEKEWAYDENGSEMIAEIEHIKKINESISEEAKIRGIVFDIEPHMLEDWDLNQKDIVKSLTSAIQKSFDTCDGLEMYICVPFYYDDLGYTDVLEEWVAKSCDGLMVMNYSVGHEEGNIVTEVKLCEKYNKRIVNIYELQRDGTNGVEQVNTYYGKGLKKVLMNFSFLKMKYQYDKLGIAYHEYNSLKYDFLNK